MKLYSTDYVILNDDGTMLCFDNSEEVPIFGVRKEAEDCAYGRKIVPTTELSEENKAILIKQIEQH